MECDDLCKSDDSKRLDRRECFKRCSNYYNCCRVINYDEKFWGEKKLGGK